MAGEDFEKDLYKNWVRGAKGLEYLQEGLQDFVGDKVQHCRNQSLKKITNCLPTGSVHQCNHCTSQNLLPEHAKRKNACNRSSCIETFPNNCLGSKPDGRRKCPNGICSKLYDEIVLDHSSRNPLWKNTDPSTWCSDPLGWSFGKCFQTTTGSGSSATTTDAAGLLSILINNITLQNYWLACNDISSKITCPFNRARDIRNAILHSPKLELDEPTLGYYLDTFITVLQNVKCLLNYDGSKQAVDKLSQLKNQQIYISQKDETRLVQNRKEALSELEERTAERLREIDDRTATALCDIEQTKDTAKLIVIGEKRGALSDIDEARRAAEQDFQENTKDALSKLEEAKKLAEQVVKECTKVALSKLEEAGKELAGGESESVARESTSISQRLCTDIRTPFVKKGFRRSTGICCDICPANLEGKKFKIKVVQNNKFWHFDGGHTVLKAVTSLWQPNDDFVKFMFEKQPDGSYKIKSVAMPSIYMYDGYGVPNAHGQVLNGNDETEDYHMRYIVSRDGSNYRIQTKATNRYVRLDPDRYVSSKHNIIDDRSLFELMEVV